MLSSITFGRFYVLMSVCVVSLFPVLTVYAQNAESNTSVIENVQVKSFYTGSLIHSNQIVDFYTQVENNGTVFERPTGYLEIFNIFGQKVATRTFNEIGTSIPPQSVQNFNITWEGDGQGFGRYQAILSVVHGEKDRQSTSIRTSSFWILPVHIILPVLGVLAFLLLSTYISMKLDVQKAISHNRDGIPLVLKKRKILDVSTLLLVTIVMLALTALFLIIILILFA
jgi:hypothetical protein